MKRLRLRIPIWAWWLVGATAFGVVCYGVPLLFVSKENAAVEWALRLPKERERARIAGFKEGKRTEPNFDPTKDAGVDWVRLDAIMKADAPEGKLPYVADLLDYANPRTRAKADRAEVSKLQKQYASLLPEAELASRKPLCYFPFRKGDATCEGAHAAALLAALHLTSAVAKRERGETESAIEDAITGIRIARQLQGQNSIYTYAIGYRLENTAIRLVREGLTVRNGAKREAWMRVFAQKKSMFLQPAPDEPLPSVQFRQILQNDFLLTREIVDETRARKYKPDESLLMESSPVLRLLNRMDFSLGNQIAADSWEASSDWVIAGLALRCRGHETERRPYGLWKAVGLWDRHTARMMQDVPRWLKPDDWANIPLRRLFRDTEQTLTQAAWMQVSGMSNGTPPDDPFAAKPNTPLRRRDLPDGSTLWYSVGINDKDDGGDVKKDLTTKVLFVQKGKR